MLPCLRFGRSTRLVWSSLERVDQPRAGLVRHDHVVDVAALGGRVRVREARLVVVHQLLAALVRGRRLGDVAAVDDVDRALRAHHRDLRGRPGEVEVGQHVLRVHDVVGAAVGLARDDRQLRHGRLGERVEQLRAVADDPAPLLARAGQEAGHVGEGDERDVERVAEADEAGGLLRRLDVEHAGELRGLVADDPDRAPAEAREAADDVRARSARGSRRSRRRRRSG